MAKKEQNTVAVRIYGKLSLLVAASLLVVGFMAWTTGANAMKEINKGIAAEKIVFPEAGTPGFDSTVFTKAQKHAGMKVTDGPTVKAYAEDYVGVQMDIVGAGSTSFEVGSAAAAAPTNAALQQQQAAMFQLGTSKTLLLSAYGGWAQAKMIKNVGMTSLIIGFALLLVGMAYMMRQKRT